MYIEKRKENNYRVVIIHERREYFERDNFVSLEEARLFLLKEFKRRNLNKRLFFGHYGLVFGGKNLDEELEKWGTSLSRDYYVKWEGTEVVGKMFYFA
jgi:hypothetical protein